LQGTTGDCGMFAIALAKLMLQEGESVQLGICVRGTSFATVPDLTTLDQGCEEFAHVVVEWHDELYDIQGLTNVNAIQFDYFEGQEGQVLSYPLTDALVAVVRRNTAYVHDWPFYLHLLQKSTVEAMIDLLCGKQ